MFKFLYSIIFLLSVVFISLVIYYIIIVNKRQSDNKNITPPVNPPINPPVNPPINPPVNPPVNPPISYSPGTHFLDKNNCISGYSGNNCETITCPNDNSKGIVDNLADLMRKWSDFGLQLQVELTNEKSDTHLYINTDENLKKSIAKILKNKTNLPGGINRANTVDVLRDYLEIYNIIFPQIEMAHNKKVIDPLLILMKGPATIYGNFGQAEDAEESTSGDVDNPTPNSKQYWQKKQMENYIYFYKLYSSDKTYEWGEGFVVPDSKINPDPTFNLYLQTYTTNPSVKSIKNRKLPNSQFWSKNYKGPDPSRSIMSNLTDIFTEQTTTSINNYNKMKNFSFIDLTASDPINNSDLNKSDEFYKNIQNNIDTYHTFRKGLRSLGRTCSKLYFLFPILNIQIPTTYTNGKSLIYHDLFYSDNKTPVTNMLLSLDVETMRKNLNLSQQDFNTLRCFSLLHVFSVDNTTDGAHSCYIRCGNNNFLQCIKTSTSNTPSDCLENNHYGCYCDINTTDYVSFMGLIHDALVDLRSFKQAKFDKQKGGIEIIRNIEKFIQPLYKQLIDKFEGQGEFTNKNTEIVSLLKNITLSVCKN